MRQSSASLDLCLRKTWTGKSHDFRDVIVFEKLFSKCFLHTKNARLAFSNSSGLKSSLKRLCFHDGLVWTVGLTEEVSWVFKFLPHSVDSA